MLNPELLNIIHVQDFRLDISEIKLHSRVNLINLHIKKCNTRVQKALLPLRKQERKNEYCSCILPGVHQLLYVFLVLKKKKQRVEVRFPPAAPPRQLEHTCADGFIPAPLSVTLTTANDDIQAISQCESRIAAHFQQGGESVGGREEAGHGVLSRG